MTKLMVPAVLLTAAVLIAPPAAGQSNNTVAAPAGIHADRVDYRPADAWLGKWSGVSSYSQTTDVWEWRFEVIRPCNDYGVRFGSYGPERAEILRINATEFEFLLHDELGTHLTMVRQGNDAYSGTVSQPNNHGLPLGRVDGRWIGEAAPASAAPCADSEEPDPYADAVVSWTFGSPRSSEGPSKPRFALGPPDYTGSHRDPGIVTLGCGGQIVVRFSDNDLVDGAGADLRIFEPGDREAYSVEISVDGVQWRPVGRAEGGNSSFDISGVAEANERFFFVRITDERGFCQGVRPGMDIDAVEALNTGAGSESAAQDVAAVSASEKLLLEVTPLENELGGSRALTGEPLDSVVTVTNTGSERIYAAVLQLALSGEAVSEDAELDAAPAKPRQDEEAAFFDVTCALDGTTATCPLGYGDRVEGGRTYLEPGEARSILLQVTAWEPGLLSVSARASATTGEAEKLEAAASQKSSFTGPILGLRLLGTTPEPYGYSDNPRLPLHEGREITLRYAILNSRQGGHARDIALDFFTRTGEVRSVSLASGATLPCGRPKPSDRQVADCVIAGLAPGQRVEVDAAFRYGRRFMVEAAASAGQSTQDHAYETGMDVDPVVTVGFAPAPSSTVAEGQRIVASFGVANRGRGSVPGGTLQLFSQGGNAAGFAIETVEGCKAVKLASGVTECTLGEFSKETPAEILVVTAPVPAEVEGSELGLVWTLKVPGHRFPYPSTANEKGYAQYSVGERVADLYVAEYLPAEDLEPGVPQVIQLEIGNKGTWPQNDAVLDLRLDLTDEGGTAAPGSHLTRASALLDNPDSPGEVVEAACEVSGNAARCALGTLRPRSVDSIIFEINSGDLAEGRYRYEARISEGQGEAGDAARTRDNTVSGGAAIFATGETVADLRVFRAQSDKEAEVLQPQAFNFWVENDGTIPQNAVGLKLDFAIETQQAIPQGLRFLRDVYAVIPSLDDSARPARRVPCVVNVGTASCALGRLEPEGLAQIFVQWDPAGVAGRYSYAVYLSEGAGEAAAKRLEDNTLRGGAAIVAPGTAVVTDLLGSGPSANIEYPASGDDVTPGSSALGTFRNLEDNHELWYFSFSPEPRWYYLRPVERDPGASGIWAIHDLSHGRPGPADVGYVYRIGILAADPTANTSLQENAARLRAFPPGTTVLHEIQVTRVGE